MCPLEMGNNSISIISELLLRIRLISTCFRGVTLVTSMPLPEPFLTRIYLATICHKVTMSLTSIPRYISHFRYITPITSINCQQCRCLKWYTKKCHNMIYIKSSISIYSGNICSLTLRLIDYFWYVLYIESNEYGMVSQTWKSNVS